MTFPCCVHTEMDLPLLDATAARRNTGNDPSRALTSTATTPGSDVAVVERMWRHAVLLFAIAQLHCNPLDIAAPGELPPDGGPDNPLVDAGLDAAETSNMDVTSDAPLVVAASWSPASPTFKGDLDGLWGTSVYDAWAVGAGGTILRWNYVSWTPQPSGTVLPLHGVWGTSTTDIWAVGDGGQILQYNGYTWSPIASGTAQALHAVWGTSANNVWAVGDGGEIRFWKGLGWYGFLKPLTTSTLRGVFGTSASDVWAVGDAGTIIHSNGFAWSTTTSGSATTRNLYGVFGSSPTDVWAVGDGGTLVRWNGTSWTPGQAEPPQTFVAFGEAGGATSGRSA